MDASREEGSAPRDEGDASDADSDLEELEGDIAKFNESVQAFLASHTDEGAASRVVRGGPRGRGGTRGPRKAAKPRGDITARLSKVNQAFMGGEYDVALDLAFEVIRINAETHQAWITVASIFQEQGDAEKALSAMIYAAHLRPKDVNGWLQCATFALDTVADDEVENLYKARVCYSAALRADHHNIDARLGKAIVCHRQGHLSAAISEYKQVLKRRPYDLEIVRRLAEACIDNKHSETVVPAAIEAYTRYFENEKLNLTHDIGHAPWQDIGIYVDLFASSGRYLEAIRELKALSRWLLGRKNEQYWDAWQEDDREWDADHERRLMVSDFAIDSSETNCYGQGLPHDLRARLAIFRLRLRNEDEATKHLLWLDPTSEHTKEFTADFPDLIFDLAEALAYRSQTTLAIRYYEMLRDIPGDTDATVFLQLGRCYSALSEHATAEEYFLAAIDADEDNIDARVELANMYEKAREDEEALILAAEAIALKEARERGDEHGLGVPRQMGEAPSAQLDKRASRLREPRYRREKRAGGRLGAATTRSVIPRRYRPKRLAGPDRRRQDEEAHAVKLTKQYEVVRGLRQQINAGRKDLLPTWMASSKELIDDFRSLKRFYSWEKYLHFLGRRSALEQPGSDQPKSELSQMYERLARILAPQVAGEGLEGKSSGLESHEGISFEKWLDLFLEYAISLAVAHRREEAYQVCEAARDSTAFQAPEHGFKIYIAWSVCAIYTSDEEKCVATARQLMRDGAMSDSYRMFALLSSLCQSPASWYTSGPAQKYILRQIKAMDDRYNLIRIQENEQNSLAAPSNATLDACLLMLYGHILFTSTSYAYALGYFLRAWALDPDNTMVNLSLGLAYVHYGLKRQSTNRQYLLLQGQSFMSRYAELSCSRPETSGTDSLAEAFYNIGRLYQLLGINYLAYEYYSKAKDAIRAKGGPLEINAIALNNELMSLLNSGNKRMALALVKDRIRI